MTLSAADKIEARGMDLLRKTWADMEQARMRREEAAAKKDPKAHRLSTVMPDGSGYRYCSKSKRIRYCYSTHRNVAGYFLMWRETVTKKEIRRDQFDSTKDKRDAISTCRRLAGEPA